MVLKYYIRSLRALCENKSPSNNKDTSKEFESIWSYIYGDYYTLSTDQNVLVMRIYKLREGEREEAGKYGGIVYLVSTAGGQTPFKDLEDEYHFAAERLSEGHGEIIAQNFSNNERWLKHWLTKMTKDYR